MTDVTTTTASSPSAEEVAAKIARVLGVPVEAVLPAVFPDGVVSEAVLASLLTDVGGVPKGSVREKLLAAYGVVGDSGWMGDTINPTTTTTEPPPTTTTTEASTTTAPPSMSPAPPTTVSPTTVPAPPQGGSGAPSGTSADGDSDGRYVAVGGERRLVVAALATQLGGREDEGFRYVRPDGSVDREALVSRFRARGLDASKAADVADSVIGETRQMVAFLSRDGESIFGKAFDLLKGTPLRGVDPVVRADKEVGIDGGVGGGGSPDGVPSGSPDGTSGSGGGPGKVDPELVADAQQKVADAETPDDAASATQELLALLGTDAGLSQFQTGLFNQYGVDPLDITVKGRVLRAYRDAFPNDIGVTDDNVYDRLRKRTTPQTEQAILMAAIQPEADDAVLLDRGPGQGQIVVPGQLLRTIEQTYPGLQTRETALIRAADQAGVPIAIVAAAAVAAGADLPEGKDPTVMEDPSTGGLTAIPGARLRKFDSDSLFAIAQDVARAKQEWGSWPLAIIATQDRALAARVKSDPYGLDQGDVEHLQEIISRVDLDLPGVAVTEADRKQMNFLKTLDTSAFQSGGIYPNETETRATLETLFRAWFRRDPAEEELVKFTETVNGEIRRAYVQVAQGNPFEGSATVPVDRIVSEAALNFARGSTDFRSLYREKPVGLSEDEYVKQFDAAGSGGRYPLLDRGESPSSAAVRIGLQTGDRGATQQRIALEKLSSGDVSGNFLDRLAAAARVLQGKT